MALSRNVKHIGGKIIACVRCGSAIAVRYSDRIVPIGRVEKVRLSRTLVVRCPSSDCGQTQDVALDSTEDSTVTLNPTE